MKRSARVALALALLLSAAAYAGGVILGNPGEIPLRELPRLLVKGLRPHPQSGRSVTPATAPAAHVAPRPFTLSLALDGLHVGPPAEGSGPALGLTWDDELRPWARLN